MASGGDDWHFTRREWLQAGAALGAALTVPACASPHGATSSMQASVRRNNMLYDVVIAGGGPAGLSAALALGRACKRILLCDAGPRRNAAAEHIHNFVTRDGTSPDEFRRIGREQLAAYPDVQLRDVRVEAVTGEKGAFRVAVGADTVEARRVLLATGMVDQMLPIEGFRELWGHAVFQCPYCHGWERKDRPWGYLARAENVPHLLPFALMLRGWTRDLIIFTSGAFELPEGTISQLHAAGIRVETAAVQRLVARGKRLEAVELSSGTRLPCDALFAHPPQRQVDLIYALGLALDDAGFVRVDPMTREASVAGIYATGDLTTRMQGALFAAASGTQAAGMINAELTAELASTGAL
jgi:thioredoxin reductase